MSSYSLRVLKSLHEIFRASLFHHWVKRLPKQLTCVAKTLCKNTRVKRGFSKQFLPTKNSSALPKTVCALPKTFKQQNRSSSYSLQQTPTHFQSFLPSSRTLLPLYRLFGTASYTKKLHSSVPANNNTLQNKLQTSEWAKRMHYTSVVRTTKVHQHNWWSFSERCMKLPGASLKSD